MGGSTSHRSEIGRGFHQSGTEEMLPEVVDRYPGGEGMIRVHEPLREIEAIGLLPPGEGRQDGRNGRIDPFAPVLEIPPDVDVCFPGGGELIHDVDLDGLLDGLLPEGCEFGLQFLDFSPRCSNLARVGESRGVEADLAEISLKVERVGSSRISVAGSDGEWSRTHRNLPGNIPDHLGRLVLHAVDEKLQRFARLEYEGDMMFPAVVHGDAAVDLGPVPRLVG